MVEPLLNSLEAVDKEKTAKLVELARSLVETKKAIKNQKIKTSEIKAKVKDTTTAKKTVKNFEDKYRKKGPGRLKTKS